jgi:hypothetical protein
MQIFSFNTSASSMSIYFNNGRQWTHFLFCALRLLLSVEKIKTSSREREKKKEQAQESRYLN